ncbi:MAG: lipoyl(octanoyl) transferase LipB [bacterium]
MLECIFLDLGLERYRNTELLQEELVLKVIGEESPGYLIFVEHPSVFTLGKSTKRESVFLKSIDEIKAKGIEVYNSSRGGSITLHEPGQLVVYPILKLDKKDIHTYVRELEELVIELLGIYNIKGIRKKGFTGVWIDQRRKICSIGVAVRRWVTYHGLALNVNNRLEDFNLIRPCGLEDVEMVSIEKVLGESVPMDELKSNLLRIFSEIFDRRIVFG